MKEYFGLGAKMYNYFKDNNDEDKKAKPTEKCAIKGKQIPKLPKLFRSSSNRENNKLFKKKD